MKRKIRKNVFETNSSSTHSISIVFSKDGLEPSEFVLNEDNELVITYGNFDSWESYGEYNDQFTKLSYLVTLCYYCFPENGSIYDESNFININEAVCKYTGASRIVVSDKVEPELNHQLIPYYRDFDLLNTWNKDEVINFVFNKNVSLILDRD